jgi:hypothetical protein
MAAGIGILQTTRGAFGFEGCIGDVPHADLNAHQAMFVKRKSSSPLVKVYDLCGVSFSFSF